MCNRFMDRQIRTCCARVTQVSSRIASAFCHKMQALVTLALILHCDVSEDGGFCSDPAMP